MKKNFLKKCAAIVMTAVLFTGCGRVDEKESSNTVTVTSAVTAANKADPAGDALPTDAAKDTAEGGSDGMNADLYDTHGALFVKGTDLVDANGEKFQLRGMSTHGIAWFPEYVNKNTFKYLRDEWNINCIRLAIYTDENMGYCNGGDQEKLKGLVKKGIEAATELDMYVIVDWHILHDLTPQKYKAEALAFFEEISKTYAENDNILYEICNEPNTDPDWDEVKSYAEEVIPVIRANDPNSIVIVGTPTWSQDIHEAAADPLSFENVMYTLHFYAATHKKWLRDRAEKCIERGLPVFISEFGICDASGNGAINYDEANAWKELIEKYNLSYMCWNLSNNNESSAIIKNGCDKLLGWEDGELKEQGLWIRDWFKSE